jgi:hypothetical protein
MMRVITARVHSTHQRGSVTLRTGNMRDRWNSWMQMMTI